jgi:hypothetical protein
MTEETRLDRLQTQLEDVRKTLAAFVNAQNSAPPPSAPQYYVAPDLVSQAKAVEEAIKEASLIIKPAIDEMKALMVAQCALYSDTLTDLRAEIDELKVKQRQLEQLDRASITRAALARHLNNE